MRGGNIFVRLLGLGRAVLEGVGISEEGLLVRARPRRRDVSRCRVCGGRAPGYDRGEGCRRWRALDLGATKAFVEAAAPRVCCREHGVVVARVPWARHGSAYGFHSANALIALAMLTLGGLRPSLPRRAWNPRIR